jgi:excisionase family DNA binding protein
VKTPDGPFEIEAGDGLETVGPLLAISDVAERLNVTPRFVRRLIAERRIRYFKIGRHVRLAEPDVADWVRRRSVEPSRR